MFQRPSLGICHVVALATALLLWPGGAGAETQTVRIAKQYGISYLPLTIMEQKQLLEAQGKKLGLDLKTEWVQFTGGEPANPPAIKPDVPSSGSEAFQEQKKKFEEGPGAAFFGSSGAGM